MCGIFGSVGEPIGAQAVARVKGTLLHRGPDGQGARELAGCHPGPYPVAGHRPVAGGGPADVQRGRHGLGHLQRARSTTSASCGASSRGRATASAPLGHRGPGPRLRGLGRRAVHPPRRDVRVRAVGHPGRVGSCWPATASGKKPLLLRELGGTVPVCLRDQGAVCRRAAARGRHDRSGRNDGLRLRAPAGDALPATSQQLPPGASAGASPPGATPQVSRYWSVDFQPPGDAPERRGGDQARSGAAHRRPFASAWSRTFRSGRSCRAGSIRPSWSG